MHTTPNTRIFQIFQSPESKKRQKTLCLCAICRFLPVDVSIDVKCKKESLRTNTKTLFLFRESLFYQASGVLLRIGGFEPPRQGHQNLNLARLPIPPYPHKTFSFVLSLHICSIEGKKPKPLWFELFSEVSGIRTPDNLIKSQVLYRLS